MRYSTLQLEPFSFNQGENEGELLEMEQFEYLESEVNRNSPDYIRWVQDSLNQVLGLQLKVDGIMGPQTRSAIRTFQQQKGLVTDGISGPKTEAALRSSLGISTPPSPLSQHLWIIDQFDFASSKLKAEHINSINSIANFIKASQSTLNPVRAVDLLGHTDPVGKDADNYRLGCLRAWSVTKQLKEKLGWQLVNKISFRVASMGERQPVPRNDSASRRVEVSLYYNMPQPFSQPAIRCDLPGKPPGNVPPANVPPGNLPPQCDKEELKRKVNKCIEDSKSCLIAAHAKLGTALIRCKLNPVCNAKAMTEYYLALRKCRDALLACDRIAKQSTNCL